MLDPTGGWLREAIGSDAALYFGTPAPVSLGVPTQVAGQRIRHLPDGGYTIVRANKEAEAVLDDLLLRAHGSTLRWYPRSLAAKELTFLSQFFEGKHVHIVGKGPSLDNINVKLIGHADPIIAINEAVLQIEALSIGSPVFGMQQDLQLTDTCKPKLTKTCLLLEENLRHWYASWPNKVFYTRVDLGIKTGCITVLHAIALTKLLKAAKVTFHAFDSLKGDFSYAASVGYLSSMRGDPKRFSTHGGLIKKALGDMPHRFV
jgi:hypothetical protein